MYRSGTTSYAAQGLTFDCNLYLTLPTVSSPCLPKKIRDIKAMLQKARFSSKPGKGNHSKWKHPKLNSYIVIARKEGDDVPQYPEKQVRSKWMQPYNSCSRSRMENRKYQILMLIVCGYPKFSKTKYSPTLIWGIPPLDSAATIS